MLSDRGYHKLPPLGIRKCNSIVEQLVKFPFTARTKKHTITGLDYASAESNVYEVADQTLIQNIPEVTQISNDPHILDVVEEFLGCKPIQTQAACWWSVNHSNSELDQCAQKFHQDLTYSRFVKLFLYLNHITMQNGPHAYVPESYHKIVKPEGLRTGGRVSDDFIKQHYPEIIYLTGKQGTMTLVDTRGYHKGTPLVSGHRLLIQLEWADSIRDVTTGQIHKQI